MWLTGLVAPRHVGSSQTRARTRVPCIGRQILNHCATREASQIFSYSIPGYLNSYVWKLLMQTLALSSPLSSSQPLLSSPFSSFCPPTAWLSIFFLLSLSSFTNPHPKTVLMERAVKSGSSGCMVRLGGNHCTFSLPCPTSPSPSPLSRPFTLGWVMG